MNLQLPLAENQLQLAENPMFEQFEVDDYLTDNTATVHPKYINKNMNQ